eukprot:CAMPEP_0169361840 /NCGR_PEP_ID=MMETSP1017-20121227/30576_1 /TAXON_ID=342587 /ORGANISM="Karlodinium micrum, Strain CCMP2283" /LENGTH=172 /DNA_ID=CAMNT_0009459293 /DNA_START=119 /DNA_END=637 /DNA_ORIENTATION=+
MTHVESTSSTASTASDCLGESLTDFDLDDYMGVYEWQEAEFDVHQESETSLADNSEEDIYAAIGDWVQDDLDEYIADWIEKDLEEYCSSVTVQRPSGKRVRFSEEISYVEPEEYIYEMVAYLRTERKVKKEQDKQCEEYARQWQEVYLEYWQQTNISAWQQVGTSECNAEEQ